MAVLQKAYARKTVRDNAKLLNKSFERFLPVGAANPFAGFVGRRAAGESETVHRKPFSDVELKALLDAARDDEFMYPLIVTAACTGMRRGDVCKLQWSAVDLDSGMLTVKTSKTGVSVAIPIFKPLLAILKGLNNGNGEYVFPDAAELLESKPDSLTWRFKKIVAKAFAEDAEDEETEEPPVPATDIRDEGYAAIVENVAEGARRDRILTVFNRYCDGQSMRQIVDETGHATVEVVLKHYFRPDREQFKAALVGAMPKVLTGRSVEMKPAQELAAIAGKLAAGTATEDDKVRFRKLAAKV